MTQRYNKSEGERSKSGKTIVRVTKSGKKYYHNPTSYAELKRKKRELAEKEGKERGEYDTQRTIPYCADKKNESYMRYFEKKTEVRSKYPKWVHMNREEWREYFGIVLDMIQSDVDYLQYLLETKTQAEQLLDEKWEQIKRKEDEYDGRNDEYDF